MAGQSVKEQINRILAWIRNLGRVKRDVAVRPITSPNKVVDSKLEDLPFGTASAETKAAAPGLPQNAAKATQNRMVPLGEKRPIGKDQWRKIKETAKEADSCEANIEHWQSKSGSALAGTSFSAGSPAGTAEGADSKQRKRPSMVTQARITSSRLQALQTRMEKPANDVDKMDEEDGAPRGH
jgi:hypothetical protein